MEDISDANKDGSDGEYHSDEESSHFVYKPIGIDPSEITPVVYGALPQSTVAVRSVKDKKEVLGYNPKYEDLYAPELGPVNPYKNESQLAQKNILTGYVEKSHVSGFHFEKEIRTFDTLGYAANPADHGGKTFVGNQSKAIESGGATLFDNAKTGREKRKRLCNRDPADIEGFTGPWTRFVDEATTAKPTPEQQKTIDEFTAKQRLKSKKYKKAEEDAEAAVEESCTLHLKDTVDYRGKSFMDLPSYTGVNLREDYKPQKCVIPKKLVHTYSGHQKQVNAIKWFPKSAHMFLSSGMDGKVKLWDVYGKSQCIITYKGHKLPVRDIGFNHNGVEFLSASFDRQIKIWDTETGQVKSRINATSIPYCAQYHPDEDKNHMIVAGLQNKKVIQWDIRSGEMIQQYDRHLGSVNSITFFDKNRRFVSTSEDKSLRIWEWEIPVDTKLIQNVGLHSIPTMTKSPDQNWIVGQSMDNRIVLFELINDKLKFARKKNFRGHNTQGFPCTTDFSPDMSYLISGDGDGKIFVWNWKTHKLEAKWKAHEKQTMVSVWHPHETSRIITGGGDGVIKMWN
uniref:WD_REPEATS_REGION domain-containing protein n=1 Tax=Rhabditophanes sp. KR3021 TaxID=114890 RepID=A0AC35THF5_9BILA